MSLCQGWPWGEKSVASCLLWQPPHWRCWFVTAEWIRDKINRAEVQRTCQRTQCAKKWDFIIVSSAQRELCWYWDTAGDGDIVGWPSNGANLCMSLLSSNSCDQAQQDLLDDYQAFISQSMLDLFYYWASSRVGKRRDQISIFICFPFACFVVDVVNYKPLDVVALVWSAPSLVLMFVEFWAPKHLLSFVFLSYLFSCSYCVYLRVKQASAACKLRLWSAHLVRERLVCAECQSDAMSKSDRCGGDGLESIRWTMHRLPV